MLFNSFTFLVFFAIVLLIHRVSFSWTQKKIHLLLASYLFYAAWNPPFVVLLWISTAVDWLVGRRLHASDDAGTRKRLVAVSLAVNLGLLGYFKYAGFVLENFVWLVQQLGFDYNPAAPSIILPLGISFYTFQTLSYTLSIYRRDGEPADSLVDFALFVTFFPQLIAGPIVHHGDMLPQFRAVDGFRLKTVDLAMGFEIFLIGLFKKVVIADGLTVHVQPVFGAAAAGDPLTMIEAWGGALAFTFQLYFDFSGYSDMAVGLAAMFGLRLPINFSSPYKATSIIEFWRRWHMTLSAFLRDYLYIPLGGNRHGPARRYTNIAVTMVLGGLWHGAAWTFVFWGALHGVLLIVNHLWRAVGLGFPRPVGWVLTFLAVCFGWVFFRASSIDAAWAMVWTMIGGQGFVPSGPMEAFGGDSQVIALLLALIWVVAAPNTQQWVAGIHGRSVGLGTHVPAARFGWMSGRLGAAALGVLGGVAIIRLFVGGYSEFLYFQF